MYGKETRYKLKNEEYLRELSQKEGIKNFLTVFYTK